MISKSAEMLPITNDKAKEHEVEEGEEKQASGSTKKRGRPPKLKPQTPEAFKTSKRRRPPLLPCSPRQRGRPRKPKPQTPQFSGTVEEGGVLNTSDKKTAEVEHVTEESERSGFFVEPIVATEVHVENSFQPPTEPESEQNNDIGASSGMYVQKNRPELLVAIPEDPTEDGELNEAGGVLADSEAEKSKSLVSPRPKLTDGMEDGTALVYLTPRNVPTDNQAAPIHIEETLANEGESGLNIIKQQVTPNSSFAKSSPVWQVIESMEVFKRHPQIPHFHATVECKELTSEGMAIAKMLHFASFIEEISNLQENASGEYLTGIINELAEFKELGFDVEAAQGRLNEWLQIKAELEKLKDESRKFEIQITGCTDEREKIDGEVAEMDKRIEWLEEKRAMLMSKRTEKGLTLYKLQAVSADMKEAVSSKQQSLRSLFLR